VGQKLAIYVILEEVSQGLKVAYMPDLFRPVIVDVGDQNMIYKKPSLISFKNILFRNQKI
jgi:hypothetical protein